MYLGTRLRSLLRTAILGAGLLFALPAAAQMYWTNQTLDTIQRAELDGTVVATVQGGVSSNGLALDMIAGKLYWTDLGNPLASGDELIRRSNLDGSSTEILLDTTDGLQSPGEIELDLSAGKMYWVDVGASGARITRANLDGSGVEVVFRILDHRAPNFGSGPGETLEFASVWGLALDPGAGQMYWTDFFGADIHRANLDGSAVSGPLVAGLATPRGIDVDPARNLMYWTEVDNSTIFRADLDGLNVQLVADDVVGVDEPFSIAIDSIPGKIYWTNLKAGTVQRADLDGQNAETLVTQSLQDLIDIAILTTVPIPPVPALSEVTQLLLVLLLVAMTMYLPVRGGRKDGQG